MTRLHELLTATRQRLTPPDAWITGDYVLDNPTDRNVIDFSAPSASCWCLVGALVASDLELSGGYDVDKVVDLLEPGSLIREAVDALNAHLPVAPPDYIHGPHDALTEFNDTHDHAEVLALLDRAIEDVAQ